MILQTRTPNTATLDPRIREAFGLRHHLAPRPWLGETDTRIVVWSIRELDALHAHAGGTVTARQADPTVIEVTVTVDVPGVGPVQVVTDWQPAEESYAVALPVIRALRPTPAAIESTVQDIAREDREYWNDRYDD